MSNIRLKMKMAKIVSFIIVVVMMFTSLPVNMLQVHAATGDGVSLMLNKDDEEPTYMRGEPIKVTATSDTSEDWVGIYHRGEIPGENTPSYYWYYVEGSYSGKSWTNGTEYNIYGTVNSARDGYTQDWLLPAGEYDMILMAGDYTEKLRVPLKIVEPTISETSLETENFIDVGQPIKVKAVNYTDQAWVGVYEGEYTGQTSLDYYYLNGYNGEYYDFGVYEEGTYEVVLFQDGGYTEISCETVTVGHIYGDWIYDNNGKENGTHTRVCAGHENVKETEKCLWDDGVITKEATEDEDGVKTYTCTQCGGRYEEVVFAKKIVDEEIITAATCTEKGSKKVIFDDGTEASRDIDPLGHIYGEWQYNENDKTHSKTCTRDGCDSSVEKNKVTEDCSFDKGEVIDGENKIKYTCKICNGSYENPILKTDKTEYKYGDPIIVATDFSTADSWVALYKQGEMYDPENGGVVSIFWYYNQSINNVDITNNLANGSDGSRFNEFVAGDYKVVLFKDGGYNDIATVNITITKEIDETKTVKEVPTCEKDGVITYTYTDGTKEIITAEKDKTLEKLGHDYDADDNNKDDWAYNKSDKTHTKECIRCTAEDGCSECEKAVVTEDCIWNDGKVTKEPTTTENGEKTYTCTICGGTYIETISAKVAVGEKVIKEATCEEEGTLRTYYDEIDGDDYIDTVIPKKGHAYPDNWTYDADTKTHVKKCANDEKHVQTKECTFSKETKDGRFVYTCNVCKGTYEESVIRTDKKKYDIDEAINVTVDYEFGVKDWVGLYKKGETPDSTETVISFIYYYPQVSGKTFNIFESDYHQRGEVEAGEYTLFLCENDGYKVIASVDITIGHEFGEWTYDADTKTHSRTCDGSMKHQDGPESCTFTGKVTKEPSETENGIKTFTCSECGGSYEEILPKTSATIVDTKTIDPTCETDGKVIFTYSDGTVKEEVLQKLGHDYDETNWVFNESDKTHNTVCKNDNSHVKTVNCSFSRVSLDGNKATYKCNVCGGTFEGGLLVVPKDTYSASEDINIIASCSTDGSWVGLYKNDDKYGENATVSMYWYYVVSGDVNRDGQTVNLTDSAFYNTDRTDSMTPGEYKIILFGDGGYSNILAQETITITESTTTYDMKINGEEVSDGDVKHFKNDDSISVTVTAKGNPGKAWVGIYTAHYTKDTDFSGITSTEWYYVADNNAKPVNLKAALREPGDYCIAIFGTNGYDDLKQIVYYTYTRDGAEIIIQKPTCTKPGIKHVTYDDGSDAYVPIAKLGHDVKTWTYDDETKTHSGVCERIVDGEVCGQTVTEECKFEAVEDKDGGRIYTCAVCQGQYSQTKDEVVHPYEEKEDRISGKTRYETATKIADQLKEEENIEKFDNIIIASGTGYADALSGTYLAKMKNAPILLVNSKDAKIMEYVADYVNSNLVEGGTVYILGGTGAISDVFTTKLAADKNHIKRIGGATRYETNIKILKEAGITGDEILVCTGNNFADSLSASALGRPVLLVNNKELLDTQKNFLDGMKNKKFFIIGGKNAISYEMEEVFRDYGGTERISGTTRYETSVKLAARFIETPKALVLAYGEDFPDGLAGGMLALKMDAALLLVNDKNKASALDFAEDNNIISGKVLGGTIRISELTAEEIFGAAKDK